MNVEEGLRKRCREPCCVDLLANRSAHFLKHVGPSVNGVLVALVPGGSTRAEDCVIVGKELAVVFLTGGVDVSAVTRLLADAEPPVEH